PDRQSRQQPARRRRERPHRQHLVRDRPLGNAADHGVPGRLVPGPLGTKPTAKGSVLARFARAPSRPSAELPRSTPPTPGPRPAVPSPIAALRGTNPSTGEKSPGSCQKEETAGVTSAEVGLTGGSVVCGVGERTRTSTGL